MDRLMMDVGSGDGDDTRVLLLRLQLYGIQILRERLFRHIYGHRKFPSNRVLLRLKFKLDFLIKHF